nr:UDP-glucuronosyltransferase 3A1-like [Cherax quadricarinatus]
MDDLPPNVRLAKWLPQQDILGDPRLRLFITHGGLLSIQEATYHGIPILGMPVFVDQHHNVRQVQDEGWGRHQAWEELTYDLFLQNIHQVINDTKQKRYEDFSDGLKEIYGPTTSGTSPLLSADGSTLLTDKEKILERWAEHFDSVLNRPSTINDEAIERLPQFRPTRL